jgi:signal transduction histidine kinase
VKPVRETPFIGEKVAEDSAPLHSRPSPVDGLTLSDISMTPEAQSAWQALRRAALRSSLRLSEGSARGRSAEELSSHLLPLAEVVWATAFHGNADAAAMAAQTPPLPVGVLLDTIRRDLLEELATAGDRLGAAATIRLMQAIDTVGDQLDDDPSHRFITRFLGAAGLEALVEVAHDMRSPLASIVLLVETMRLGQSGPITDVQERQLSLIYGATFGLSLMANDVIELARSDEGIMESAPIPFSIQDVMESVREIVQPIAEEKKLTLTLEPPAADWRIGHPTPLHRVLLNLTTNALKFTDAGYVHVSAQQLSRTVVEFRVSDSGKGIPDHLMASLFDAFRQNHVGGKSTFSSSGLGLAICRKFVRTMGGELTAENVAGGSTFRFTIDLPISARF